MKAYIIQPYYSVEQSDLQKCYDAMIALLDGVGEDADIIVLPEYCDIPAACRGKESFHRAIETYNEQIKVKAREAAVRCHAHGIRCNFCQANDSALAKEMLDRGIDCVLTDDFHRVKAGLEALASQK